MSENRNEAYRVYSTIARHDNGEDWLSIGLAVPHQDGKGFDVMLQALPLKPKLVLRQMGEGQKRARDPGDDSRHREPGTGRSLKQQLDTFERALIEQCLVEAGGKIGVVLERLDIPRRTLNDKMARLGIDRGQLMTSASPNARDGTSAAEAAPSNGMRQRAATASKSTINDSRIRRMPSFLTGHR